MCSLSEYTCIPAEELPQQDFIGATEKKHTFRLVILAFSLAEK